jgi:hypothetical protein
MRLNAAAVIVAATFVSLSASFVVPSAATAAGLDCRKVFRDKVCQLPEGRKYKCCNVQSCDSRNMNCR